MVKKTVRESRLSPWFDGECRLFRCKSRMLERRYRRTHAAMDCMEWIRHVQAMHAFYEKKQHQYWNSRIQTHAGNPRKLWKSLNAVLARDGKHADQTSTVTAEALSEFFMKKVSDVRAATEGSAPPTYTEHDGLKFEEFFPITEEQVRHVLMESSTKTCALDPLPHHLFRELIDDLLPFIFHMCSSSINSGFLPESQKFALVTPVIKKQSLDPDEPKNYRPISNLTLISKVIERLVGRQITDHLKRCELMPVLQSAYRSGHSTESCLLKVMSDILDAADSGEVSLVGLLDLSAAFDTVDHKILLHRLRSSFGIGGVILDWIGSFLTNRTQAVVFCGERSSVRRLNCGVPQGSVLGPLLFILYTADVIRIAGSMGVKVHCYADDTQLYISGSEKDVTTTASRMIECINAISTWMSSNRLKLNGDKTQFIWMGSRQRLMKIQQTALFVQGAELSPLSSVRDLGFIMDSRLTMSDHISSVVRSCFFQLRQLRSVRHSLPVEARRSLIHCFISCRIDYCNANLYGISGILLRRLQTVLNAAARLVIDAGKRQHMTPILEDLHWLPVKEQILYKIGILTFHCVRGTGPDYLAEMFTRVSDVAGRAGL